MSSGGLVWSFGEDVPPDLSPPRELGSGRVFGGFQLEGTLGRGGMAAVFRARHLESGREVALKVLHGRSSPERLRREGELVRGLDHPGIVKLLACGEQDGQPWLAYELVGKGRTLGDALPGLTRPERLELVLEVARALGHAHARGVVHRDVKPQNVLIDAAGRARLTDFGLGKAQDSLRLTASGALVGTAAWMSPEQLRGEGVRIGPAGDVWALGALLHLALCGEPPYHTTTLIERAAEVHAGPPPPPSRQDPTIPPALDAVCARALAVDPAERYPHGDAFAEALQAALTAPHAPPARRRARRWLGLGLALGLLVALAAGAVALTRTDPAPKGPAPAGPAGPTGPEEQAAQRRRAAEELRLAQAAFENSDPITAEDRVRAALSLDETSSDAWELLGRVRGWGGDLRSAERAFSRALELDPRRGQAWALRAGTRYNLGDVEGARADQARAEALVPDDPDVSVLGMYLRMHDHDYPGTVAAATRLIDAGRGTSTEWAYRAWARAAQGDLAGGALDAEQALRADPRDGFGWSVRADIHGWEGQLDRAVEAARRGVELAPENGYAHAAEADALRAKGLLTQARQAAERARQRGARDAYAHAVLAEVHLAAGDADEALAMANLACTFGPKDPRARLSKGLALAGLRRSVEARAELEALVEDLAPASPLLGPARRALAALGP